MWSETQGIVKQKQKNVKEYKEKNESSTVEYEKKGHQMEKQKTSVEDIQL